MAQKDVTEKALEAYNDVFSDIVNVFLFGGEQRVKAESLEEAATNSIYFDDEKFRQQDRDIAKYWNNNLIRIARLNIENQTEDCFDMPIRVMNYDSAGYRSQMGKRSAEKKYVPIITMVLYFNYEKRWLGPRNLRDCVDALPELKAYINDYPIQVFEVAFQSEEEVQLFCSDFRYVADYLVQMRKSRDYIPSPDEFRHYYEVCHLLSLFTNDHRFEEAAKELHEKKGRKPRCVNC